MGANGLHRNGTNKSVYLTVKAAELLARVAISTRRSQSEIICLLVETYGPDLLVEAPRQ